MMMKKLLTPLVLIGILLGSSACSSFKHSETNSGSTDMTIDGVKYLYEYENRDRHLKVEDPVGIVVFDGPVNTEKQRASVPTAYQDKLKAFEAHWKKWR